MAAITQAAGSPPRGWHTRSATSENTRRLLAEQGGFLYDSNAYNDDLPYLVRVGARERLVLPYAFDTNDMRFQRGGGFVFGDLDSHDASCRFLARHSGLNVLAVAYRLAPEHPFPTGVEDALAAFRWARARSRCRPGWWATTMRTTRCRPRRGAN